MDCCFLSHFLLCMKLWGKTKFCVDHTVFFHFRKDKINSLFQCLFCLKKRKRQVKAFQKIIEIFAGIRHRKERKKLFICGSRKRDLLQCGKFSGYLCGNAAVQMCVEIDVVINSIFCFHRR